MSRTSQLEVTGISSVKAKFVSGAATHRMTIQTPFTLTPEEF